MAPGVTGAPDRRRCSPGVARRVEGDRGGSAAAAAEPAISTEASRDRRRGIMGQDATFSAGDLEAGERDVVGLPAAGAPTPATTEVFQSTTAVGLTTWRARPSCLATTPAPARRAGGGADGM